MRLGASSLLCRPGESILRNRSLSSQRHRSVEDVAVQWLFVPIATEIVERGRQRDLLGKVREGATQVLTAGNVALSVTPR
jgi:hypothetical protein